ncbi:MAG TPA: hypothetical protein VHC20_02805 [Candidatus Paceibacterota bacterium]|nr:hypothetical protein [Candidatus Paceibacterota bacterium]
MIKDYPKFLEHLKKTGRMKLLPQVLRELKEAAARDAKLAPRTESAKDNPDLISGSRTLENGMLTDTTGKRALIDMYKNITQVHK